MRDYFDHFFFSFKHKNPEDANEVPGGFITDCNSVSSHGVLHIHLLVSIDSKVFQPNLEMLFY